MSTVREIERAIETLPPEDKWNLLCRFDRALWEDWDRQIEDDLKAGRLDALIAEARADMTAGRTRPLDEVLHDG